MADFIPLGSFGKTATEAVTATAVDYINPGPYGNVVVLADRKVHLARGRDATTDDVLILADTYARVALDKGETLSIVLADDETDGVVRITEVIA